MTSVLRSSHMLHDDSTNPPFEPEGKLRSKIRYGILDEDWKRMLKRELDWFPGVERFTFNDKIDSGGYGVILALKEDRLTDDGKRRGNTAARAVKVANRDPQAQLNLKHESQVYQYIGRHPFIVEYFGEDLSVPEIYMRLAHHGSVHLYLVSHRSTDILQRLRWCFQLATAVAYLHKLDVYHCDINWDNILVDDDMCVRLCDFGSASLHGSQPLNTGTAGFEDPSHPPVFTEKAQLDRLDRFALGSTFYALMTGSVPYVDLEYSTMCRLFNQSIFPDTKRILLGSLITDCWAHRVVDDEEIINRVHACIQAYHS